MYVYFIYVHVLYQQLDICQYVCVCVCVCGHACVHACVCQYDYINTVHRVRTYVSTYIRGFHIMCNNSLPLIPSPQPPEIGCLVALEELWLDSNQLRELPEEIGQLHSLVSADITKNKLEFLPPSIQHLVNLKDLHVSENYLTTVPDTIGECFVGVERVGMCH